MERVPGDLRRREGFAGPPDLARFFKGERLETMPSRAGDRLAVLTHIAGRRFLVDAHLLTRERNEYRRV